MGKWPQRGGGARLGQQVDLTEDGKFSPEAARRRVGKWGGLEGEGKRALLHPRESLLSGVREERTAKREREERREGGLIVAFFFSARASEPAPPPGACVANAATAFCGVP